LVNVRQDELAALAGVSRQSANRELKRLEAAGLIKLSYGRLEVVDPSGLGKLGQAD
jgi:CRP/FNR family transcriptional regulator, cyclic AMP receptor protein